MAPTTDSLADEPKKRGRGRPPKNGVAAVKKSYVPTGRPRGRPRGSGTPKKPAYVPTGRPRGRPPGSGKKKSATRSKFSTEEDAALEAAQEGAVKAKKGAAGNSRVPRSGARGAKPKHHEEEEEEEEEEDEGEEEAEEEDDDDASGNDDASGEESG
ncbi:unnamed protein product [Parascedosporium putredinis]|uniref:Uncharacterized protein n=1 Tax=Parascedosporium putredinis TaxID=1442378 RepID=A0A9P1GTY1_9PEZI|nr:unnamed protein product [Parascedosporium putredinis]CAI7987300.1 unnamed protein product [Parascedosporium putredinis]